MSAAIEATYEKQYEEEVGILPEDLSRAGVYGLLSSLFYSPPTARTLRSILDAGVIDDHERESSLVRAWQVLRDAMRDADPAAIKQEYDEIFISTGRPVVSLFGSAHLEAHLREMPLAQLRDELASLGLARKSSSFETEDHISALCDVMRFLIAGSDAVSPATLEAQRGFFLRHIGPWYAALCAAISQAPGTDFYRKVAAFAKEFFDLEVESFEIA